MQVTIHDVAFGGAGVGRLTDGQVVFVPYTLAGELVQIRLTKARKGFSEAELVKIITPSPHRVPPPCAYFGKCGGCQYQHANYPEQLRIKEKQVRDTLERIGGFKSLPPIHTEAAANPYGYRNKISVHSDHHGKIGFFTNDQHTIIDIDRCQIASENLNEQLGQLKKARSKRHHITLVDSSQRTEGSQESFQQVNSGMAKKLLEWVRQQIGEIKGFELLDLYCGSGFFTLGLADRFTSVSGVDRDERAIHTAIVRAKNVKAAHARFFAAAVEEQALWLLETVPLEKTVLLVDPPREGLSPAVINTILNKPCIQIIYVSCNPATLARDLKILVNAEKAKYSFSALGIFDMFPQTAHIETVAVLEKQNEKV